VDIFGLLAYQSGLRLSSSLISTGVYTSLILLVGFGLLGEPVSVMRLLALGLIAGGILLLHAQGV
jgi:multidrug transporter EmrE-like cation transporter